MLIFLYALVAVVSLLLIGIILIQPSKSGGMGAAFGGVGESVFGGQASSHLTKATVVMTAVFFVLALVLATLVGRGWNQSSDNGLTDALEEAAVQVQAAPSEAASAPAKTE